MLSRRHIRIKIMQTLFAYYISGGSLSKRDAIKELKKSFNSLYQLYIHLFSFLLELIHYVELYDDEAKTSYIPSAQNINANKKFYSNALATLLKENKVLTEKIQEEKIIWDSEQSGIFRKVLMDLKNQEIFKEYIGSSNEANWEELEIFTFILKHYPNNFPLVIQLFEEKYINWFDDSKVAIQMTVKTLKKFSEDPDNGLQLLEEPLSDDDNLKFAIDELTAVIDHDKELDGYIVTKIDKWEPSRVVLLDMIILKMGLSEYLYFSNIPSKVTINECIELAKNYSSPNSKKFINGVLDNLLSIFIKENKIKKTGLGLM